MTEKIMTHNVPTDKKNQIIAMYRDGSSLTALGHLMGLSRESVRRLLEEAGERIRSIREQATVNRSEDVLAEVTRTLVAMREQGKMMKVAAQAAGVRLPLARKLLRSVNRGDLIDEPRAHSKTLTEAQHDMAVKLWSEGVSKCAIARAVGCSNQSVTTMLDRRGVENLYDNRGTPAQNELNDGQIADEVRAAEKRDRAAIVVRYGRPEFGMTVEEARDTLRRLGPPLPITRQCGTAAAMCAELGSGVSRAGVGGRPGRSSIEERRRRESVLALTGAEAA